MSPVARGRVDRPPVAGADQAREPADVVVVGVRDNHGVELAGVERELTIGAVGIGPIGVKEPVVEQDPVSVDLQQVGRARHLPGRAMERDTQTTILPPRPPP